MLKMGGGLAVKKGEATKEPIQPADSAFFLPESLSASMVNALLKSSIKG